MPLKYIIDDSSYYGLRDGGLWPARLRAQFQQVVDLTIASSTKPTRRKPKLALASWQNEHTYEDVKTSCLQPALARTRGAVTIIANSDGWVLLHESSLSHFRGCGHISSEEHYNDTKLDRYCCQRHYFHHIFYHRRRTGISAKHGVKVTSLCQLGTLLPCNSLGQVRFASITSKLSANHRSRCCMWKYINRVLYMYIENTVD